LLDDMDGGDGVVSVEQVLPWPYSDKLGRDGAQVIFHRRPHDRNHVPVQWNMTREVSSMGAMMLRAAVLITLLVPAIASAQTMPGHHHSGMAHAPMGRRAAATPVQPGQGAFAAIQEIVEILEADPTTDWSKVNIEACPASATARQLG
jgi:hypothetical protein